MNIISHNCPRCHTKSSAFDLHVSIRRKDINYRPSTYIGFDTLGQCKVCKKGVIFGYEIYQGNWTKIDYQTPDSLSYEPKDALFDLKYIIPETSNSSVPQFTPDPINGFYVQATQNMNNDAWDSAGAMCRKVLDVGTKLLARTNDIDLNKQQTNNLAARILRLHEVGKLTDELRDWAQKIKNDGNFASHDEDPFSQTQAEELFNFTQIFLTYTFTLPGMLASKRPPEENGTD